MKKYAILLVLSVVATVTMGQHQNATLQQYGALNAAFIKQAGNHNNANVYQTWYYNGARVEQYGNHHTAFMLQVGSFNYGYLKQNGNHAYGDIKQFGIYNLALVEQAQQSTALVTQYGFGNIAASGNFDFDCNQPGYDWWCFNRCSLEIPKGYAAIQLGKKDNLQLYQDGSFNRFFANGDLEGQQWISQKGHANFMLLEQDGGYSNLRQKGTGNMLWLSMDNANSAKVSQYGYKNRVALDLNKGNAWIYQRGANNSIANYEKDGICFDCPSKPATFEGDYLTAVQIGSDNRLSLRSESVHSNVTVTQWGQSNYGTVIQTNNGNGNGNSLCNGCGSNN